LSRTFKEEPKMKMNKLKSTLMLLGAPLVLAACAGADIRAPYTPGAIAVPAGHEVALKTVGIGEITYECRAVAGMDSTYGWAFAEPSAVLWDYYRTAVLGKYYGSPTWEASDGSKVTGKQVAISAVPGGNIPLQLVQANPTTGTGAMSGITYIQRINTVGGDAPTTPCTMASAGARQQVKYQADYVMYKAMPN